MYTHPDPPPVRLSPPTVGLYGNRPRLVIGVMPPFHTEPFRWQESEV